MAYCTVEDILADFKAIEIDDSETKIVTDEAEEIIKQETNYIDGRIGVRYVTPVADTNEAAFSILKRICIFRCGERIKNILEIKTGESQMDSEVKQARNVARTPNDDLDLITKGLLLLSGVPLVSSRAGVSSFNSENCVRHQIDVTKQQW